MNDTQCVLHALTWPAWFVCDVPSIHHHGDPRHQGTKEMMMNEVMIFVLMMRMNVILGHAN